MKVSTAVDSETSLVAVPGFRAAAVSADVRGKADGRLDLALVLSDVPCVGAGVFTRNTFAAAPVSVCRDVLGAGGPVRGVVLNSGNANACTGKQGRLDAEEMQRLAAEACGVKVQEMLICSTGRIGEPLPMARLRPAIQEAAKGLSRDAVAGRAAAEAILTSDTRPKLASRRIETSRGVITIAGMAKGAGMINPSMATMLACIATDAIVSRNILQSALAQAARSFHSITVDDDTSTNDTVLLLANGLSGVSVEEDEGVAAEFQKALDEVCALLAEKIVGDGERISKVVEVLVTGAASHQVAERLARSVGGSLLVKTSWFGGDPNWGRVLCAAGMAGVSLAIEEVTMEYVSMAQERLAVFAKGEPVFHTKEAAKRIVQEPCFTIHLQVGEGQGTYRLLSTDLTVGYVDFNKSE